MYKATATDTNDPATPASYPKSTSGHVRVRVSSPRARSRDCVASFPVETGNEARLCKDLRNFEIVYAISKSIRIFAITKMRNAVSKLRKLTIYT